MTIAQPSEFGKMVTVPDRSPLDEAVSRVGDRWALLLVHALLAGPRRFNELQEDLPGIAPNVLTQRLRHLEREGVLRAVPYSERPVRMVYELTASGQELAGALRLLAQWGAARSEDAEPLRHATCGSALEARWWCPTCDRVVDDAETPAGADEVRFL
ncbi:MAG: helix-turn-helix transcriptional regulator [Actinomycetota bacterium]|nr:helix-turn-helix transcriptional regulator [Actinomycetota bacterium]